MQIHLCFLFQIQPLYQAHYSLTDHFKNAHVNIFALKQKLARASIRTEWGQFWTSFESPLMQQAELCLTGGRPSNSLVCVVIFISFKRGKKTNPGHKTLTQLNLAWLVFCCKMNTERQHLTQLLYFMVSFMQCSFFPNHGILEVCFSGSLARQRLRAYKINQAKLQGHDIYMPNTPTISYFLFF